MDATAKDFRTWHATVLAAAALAETDEPGETKASRKRAVSAAMKEVAEFLGNTPALARTSYVDPRVVDAYEEGRTIGGHHAAAPDGRRAAGGAGAGGAAAAEEEGHGAHRRRRATSPRRRSTRSSTPPTGMRGGGGVDGAIHRAGGPAVLEDCVRRFPDGLATGDAGWTTAGEMPARWVIHVVGPNYAAGQRDRSLLTSCYSRALEVADELGARTHRVPAGQRRDLRLAEGRRVAAAVDTLRATPTRGRGGAAGRVRRRDVRRDRGSSGG